MSSIKSTSYLSNNTSDQYLTNNLLVIGAAVLVVSAIILFPEISEAADVKEVNGQEQLGKAYVNIKGLVEGYVGKTIAIVAFVGGLLAGILKFNPVAIGGAFGTALAAGLGPAVIESVVGAAF